LLGLDVELLLCLQGNLHCLACQQATEMKNLPTSGISGSVIYTITIQYFK